MVVEDKEKLGKNRHGKNFDEFKKNILRGKRIVRYNGRLLYKLRGRQLE